jgi:hypothetical protein
VALWKERGDQDAVDRSCRDLTENLAVVDGKRRNEDESLTSFALPRTPLRRLAGPLDIMLYKYNVGSCVYIERQQV